MSNLINQIYHLQQDIFNINQQITEKREEWRRLNKALGDLRKSKQDFHAHKKLCLQPKLTTKTWHGDLADDYDSFRKNDLQKSYLLIPDKQLVKTLGDLKEKISETEETIKTLEKHLASLQSSMSTLQDMFREEQMQLND